MLGTANISESVELAYVTRGDFIESRHAGSAVVLEPSGDTVLTLGNPEALMFTRSALKPVQLLAMHAQGLELANEKERAVALASHNGSHAHAEIVWQMLKSGGLEPSHLKCPAAFPMGAAEERHHIASGGQKRSILHCCSGKHAAMLRTCLVNDWDLESYLTVDHPLQVAIKEAVQRFTGEASHIAVDGCGAPTHAISLTGLARGIRRMATSKPDSPFKLQRDAYALLQSAKNNAWVVGGEGAGDTIVMDELQVFSKFGAEGSVVVATEDGYVAAVRVLDGSSRAVHAVAVELLLLAGAIDAYAAKNAMQKLRLSVFGGGSPVGEIRVADFKLFS